MNVEQVIENKNEEVLSFRIESIDLQALTTGLRMLNPGQTKRVKRSDLARKAFRRGLSLAMQEEIAAMEQEEKQRKELERAKGFEPSTFTLAMCMPVPNMALPMLDNHQNGNGNDNGHSGQSVPDFGHAGKNTGHPVRKARGLRREHFTVH